MSNKSNVSRFLSLVLRHQPETIGIKLDKNGWVDVDELLSALETNGKGIEVNELEDIVATNNKKRFAFNDTKTRIRASQGHSLKVDLALKKERPPFKLFHGTSYDNMLKIMKTGLNKMKRDHVHLSDDLDTAEGVGSRQRGQTVILEIDSGRMHTDGVVFYKSANGVWLTEFVDKKYIS